MKAAILKAPGHLVLEEVARPACPEGGLLVKTGACSICRTDAKMYKRGHRDLAYPRILGHEVAGMVVESDATASLFKAGDRVQIFPGICCGTCPPCRRGADNQCQHIGIIGFSHDGGFAEYLSLPPQSVTAGGVNLLPAGLSYEEAALAEPLASCLNGQQLANVARGDSVLILGAGPIGLLHAMLARDREASRILVAECLPSRLKTAKPVSIDRIIDIEKESLAAVVPQETGGQGVDVILVACAEADVSSLPALLAPRGRLCLFSGLPPEKAETLFDANLIHYRELTIVGAYGSTAAQNSAALELVASGRLPIGQLITRRLPLDEIVEGMEYVAKRAGLKAVVTFS